MIHIFDTLSTVVGQLNSLNKDYNGKSYIKSIPRTPDFVTYCIDRMIDNIPDFCTDTTKSIDIEKSIFVGTGNSFAPVYIVTVSNINRAAVDKVTVIINHKNEHGPGIATVVIVPSKIFDPNTSAIDTAIILKDIYFGILGMDNYMSFKASASLLRFYKSPKIYIPMYDIEMVIAAIACININMKNWFFDNNGNPANTSYTYNAFTEKELPDNIRNKLNGVLNKYNNTNELRDSIGNGKIIKHFMDAN